MMIAYCGLHCDDCEMFKVTQENDQEQKERIAKRWFDQTSIEFEPEDINCQGCKSDLLSGWCQQICKVRPCAVERKVETCAHCDSYPCPKITELLSDEPLAKANLEKIRFDLKIP